MAGEFATSVGFSAALALIDLDKAFEHIQFTNLWRMGVKHGFPLRLLRFRIGVYGGPGLLLVENVATNLVRSEGSAVVSGCVHAITLMKPALVDSVDHTLKKLPSLFAGVVVDDTQFQAVGKSQQVSQQLQRAIRLKRSRPRGFLQEARDHKRREDPHRRAQPQGACGCSPHVHEEPAAGNARAPWSW